MSVQAEVDEHPRLVERITTVARRSLCPAFCDILWPPAPHIIDVLDDPGVMFESPHRVVVFQRVGGDLRYYAGGWCPDQDRICLEQDRIEAEGCEMGTFESVADALAFAEQYLAEERGFASVEVPRALWHSFCTRAAGS
jgi:hypothetical protein